jgi:hypothetical protein
MKIHLNFKGIPVLYKTLNKKKEIDIELARQHCTIREIVDSLVRQFGTPIRKALLDAGGDIDMEIRVVLNDDIYLGMGRMETMVEEGDSLAFRGAS